MMKRVREETCVVSVDVGMNALGWARWMRTAGEPIAPPGSCGVISVPGKLMRETKEGTAWSERFRWLMRAFQEKVFDEYQPDVLALEWPEFRASSAMGHAAASRDNLTQLAFAGGAHACMAFMAGHEIEVRMIPVSEWKGMLPKLVVEKRIRRAVGQAAVDGTPFVSHAWDAVGIGLHALGYRMDGKDFA